MGKFELKYSLNLLCNDSTACLYTGLAEDPNTRLGLILGTGFNVALLRPGVGHWTSVNSLLGNFGDGGEMDDFLTCFDRALLTGEMSTHKNEQVLEKMITGKYIAEIFR